jgi:hypothetical protein
MLKLIAVGAVLAISSVIGFAATDTGPASRVGDWSGQVSGYVVSNVSYNVDHASPENLASVEFDLNAVAKAVKVQLRQSGGSWHDCTDVDGAGPGNHWMCNATGETVAGADALRVVAVR